MKITGPISFPESHQPDRAGSVGPSTVQGRADQAAVVRDDSQLSTKGTTVNTLQAQLGNLPDVRQDRVQALALQVREGRYQVDNQQIAGAMFAQLLEPNTFPK